MMINHQLNLTRILNVFISSKDHLEDERLTARDAILHIGMNPGLVQTKYWTSTSHFDEYVKRVENSDIVISILEDNPTIAEQTEAEYYKYVEKEINTAFKAGKTLLLFIKKNNEAGSSDKKISKLIERMQNYVFAREFDSCSSLYTAIQSAILSELNEAYSDKTEVIESSRFLYENGADLIESGRKTIIIAQKTPSIIFGYRKNNREEKKCWESVWSWLESPIEPDMTDKEFICLYNIEEVEREFTKNINEYDLDIIEQNIRNLSSMISENIHIIGVAKPLLKFGIIDHRYILWLAMGEQLFGITQKDISITTVLYRLTSVLMQNAKLIDKDAIEHLTSLVDQAKRRMSVWESVKVDFLQNKDNLEDGTVLFNAMLSLRKMIVPALSEISKKPLNEQVLFMQKTRSDIWTKATEKNYSIPSEIEQYLAISDTSTASFGLSDDRVHGEHHKFDVVYFGLLLFNKYWPKSHRGIMPYLLLIALNDHDEGRRVAGDHDHADKSSEMIKIRMRSIGAFHEEDIHKVALAVKNHSQITVQNPSQMPNDPESLILYQTLLVADLIAMLDPLRITGYLLKNSRRTQPKNTLRSVEERTTHVLKCIQNTAFKEISTYVEKALTQTNTFLNEFLSMVPDEELYGVIKDGGDVREFCSRYHVEIPALPVYESYF